MTANHSVVLDEEREGGRENTAIKDVTGTNEEMQR